MAYPTTKSSVTGKTASQIEASRVALGKPEVVMCIKFGPWTFFDDDYGVFHDALISYLPEIIRLSKWVAKDKSLDEFELGCTSGTNREMVCEWCQRTANCGVDDESENDGEEEVQDVMFAGIQILNCCFVRFFRELLKWGEQATVWAEQQAVVKKARADRLLALAKRGEDAQKSIEASDVIIAKSKK